MEWEEFNFLSKLMSSIIIVITFLLIIIYIRDKNFHDYPCYFNIFLSVVISLDNLFRILPYNKGKIDFMCHIQSFTLIFLDKLMLYSITVYSIIQYLGVVKLKFYQKNKKIIFYLSLIISLLSSLILGFVFWFKNVRQTQHGHFCYVKTGDNNNFKETFDSIISFVLFLVNLFCIIQILLFIQKESKKNEKRKKLQLTLHFWRFFIYLYLSSFTFLIAILLINELLFVQNESKHLTYITVTFIVHLFYTLNLPALYGFKDLITCKKPKEKVEKNNDDDDEDDEYNCVDEGINKDDIKQKNENDNVQIELNNK